MAHGSKYTKEKLEIIVKESKTLADVLRKLGLLPRGGSYKIIKNKIINFGIDCSHFTGRRQYGKDNPRFKSRIPTKFLLVENSSYMAKHLKKRIIEEGLIPYKCKLCNLLPTWNNKPLVLQLDHINGICTDNRLENLRFLCPNCHTQTDTFGSRNLKRIHIETGDTSSNLVQPPRKHIK